MRTFNITFLLVFASISIYGQYLNDSITKFEADCSDAVSSEDCPDEFVLLRLTTNAESATLNFEIIANCAQNKRGVLSISGDTLTIDKTNMAVAETTRYERLDSAGNVIEIIEETHIGDVAFCDCLVNFYYELSTSLENIKFLTFHGRTFQLIRTE